jgi:hypothetical protein
MVNLQVMLCLELGPVKPKQVEIYILTDMQHVVNKQVEEGKKIKKIVEIRSACLHVYVSTVHQSVYLYNTPYINAYVIQNKLVLS